MNKRAAGYRGEQIASKYLIRNGYEIIQSNYSNRYGEIDLIAHCGQTLVFVEVKCRSSARFGWGIEAIGKRKMEKLRNMALYYIQENNVDQNIRFDVVDIMLERGSSPIINHIPGAF